MSSVITRRVAIVASLAVIGVISTVAASRPAEAVAAEASESVAEPKWLAGLKAPHRQLFDSPAPEGGIPLVHIMNFLDTYNKAFGVPDSKINAVGTFYGKTTFHGLNDAMWTKYRIAEFLKGVGVADVGATPNPWRTAPTILGMSIAPASIESLQKRGATFIICNNALGIFSGMLAQSQGLDPKAVYEDMKANILPGVELVPAMVIAIDQAQQAGISYHRQ